MSPLTVQAPSVRRVLVIDDDHEHCEALQQIIEQDGSAVVLCHDGLRGLELAQQGSFDLVIHELTLRGLGGLQLIQRLRHDSTVPVLVLSRRADDFHRIVSLELGADDYLTKPANPRELVARMRALWRRANGHKGAETRLTLNGVTLDTEHRRVECDDQAVPVTTLEFTILDRLMRARGEVVPRSELVVDSRSADNPQTRAVDMHVSQLRRKLARATDRPLIMTVHRTGYRFVASPLPSDTFAAPPMLA